MKKDSVISTDGTVIAYEKLGAGPNLVLVHGALGHRELWGGKDLAELLAKDFTVIFYDRRGRGESTDTKPYAVEREIEDLAALVNAAGDSVYLYGASSGAALALQAAEKLGPGKIKKLALYELPYGSASNQEYNNEKNKVAELIANNKPGEAVAFFMGRRGTTPEQLEKMKTSPEWTELERVGPTLVYDFEVLGDGRVPVSIAKNIAMPTLVMDGEKSFDFMRATADSVGKAIPRSVRKTIKGQTHAFSAEVAAPVLREFFLNQAVKK